MLLIQLINYHFTPVIYFQLFVSLFIVLMPSEICMVIENDEQ